MVKGFISERRIQLKVLNFGSLNIDHVYDVEQFPMPGETIDSLEYKICFGGKGLNQSIALQRCGLQVYHAGAIGKDGLVLKEALDACGVNSEHIEISEVKTGHALIQVNNQGENCIILYHGANKQISREQIDRVLQDFEEDDTIILQNEISNINYILERAHQKGMKIILNLAPYTNEICSYLISNVSYLILNESEAKGLSKCSTVKEAMKKLEEEYQETRFVITLGADGSYFFGKGKTIYQKAYKVSVIDTTAAGDTFIGYFVGSLLKGGTEEKAMDIAAKASAITVMKKGASNSIPRIYEVEQFIFE